MSMKDTFMNGVFNNEVWKWQEEIMYSKLSGIQRWDN